MNDIFKMAEQAYHALSIAESELKRLYKENAELKNSLKQSEQGVIMTDLRKAAEMALEFCEDIGDLGGPYPHVNGTAVVSDSRKVLQALRQALTQPVDAVNTSQKRVDETAKREHEPWPSVQCACGGTIYFKYTPPISDYHEGWEEGFKAAKREWVGLTEEDIDDIWKTEYFNLHYELPKAIEAKLKEKNT